MKFFEVIGTGDTVSLAALFTPDSRPDEAQLRMVSLVFGSSGIKMSDVKTRLVSENATVAQVEVLDVTMAVAGESVRMSDTGTQQNLDFNLKQVDGEWLIEAGGEIPFIPSSDQLQMPTVPQGST